ncbi:MAG: restriction endonuclease subunit R [Betaproteobacteria bacterium]|nr:MAG: restriction endonuclease subunit R [Betaproteobacteria bacterium]
MPVSKKVADRLVAGLKKYQPIVAAARARDANETDTVTIVKDMLNDVFGYDKYTEVTSEYAIKGNYCDLAIKLDGSLATLIEVKAVGLDLKDNHVMQAVNYAANQGTNWVLLTNCENWRVYRIKFAQPIEHELVVDINISSMNGRLEKDLDLLHLWCKEGWTKSALGEYHAQKQALSRYVIAALIMSDTVLDTIRREVKKMSPDVRVDSEEILRVIEAEVLKREVLDGEKATDAKKRVVKAAAAVAKAVAKAKEQRVVAAQLANGEAAP